MRLSEKSISINVAEQRKAQECIFDQLIEDARSKYFEEEIEKKSQPSWDEVSKFSANKAI